MQNITQDARQNLAHIGIDEIQRDIPGGRRGPAPPVGRDRPDECPVPPMIWGRSVGTAGVGLATSGSFTGDPVKDFGTAVLDAAVADTGFSSAKDAEDALSCGWLQAEIHRPAPAKSA